MKDKKKNHEKKSQKFDYKKFLVNLPFLLAVCVSLAFIVGALFQRFLTNRQSPIEAQEQLAQEIPETEIKPTEEENPQVKFVPQNPPPEVSASAYGVFSLKDGVWNEFATKNPDLALPPASVTKIMTAIIALERYDLDKPVVVPPKCTQLNGSSVGFAPNQVFTLEDMLYALLVKSGADAACAIANIDDEPEFIAEMNQKANELGMVNTSFENEIGFDSDQFQFASVYDLEKLTKYALNFSTFRKIVGTKEISLRPVSQGGTASYTIRNTNDLLFSLPGTVGIKTGTTPEAGECLIYLYENRGNEFLILILGSQDRFGDTTKLLEWAKDEFQNL